MGKLQGKVAIVTGGASGIGRETCMLFAREGAKVVVADRDYNAAIEVVNTINAQLYEVVDFAIPVFLDVANRDSVKRMVDTIIEACGRIDILVNNAGITGDNFIDKLDYETIDRVLEVNLKGVINCTKEVVPIMKSQQYGKILSASSVVGLYGNVAQVPYSAAKAGVIGMTKTLSKELGRFNICVNAVAPGFIETPMTDVLPDKVLVMMRDKTPLKRLGQASDIAEAYLYLATADYVNGAILSVDGGLTL